MELATIAVPADNGLAQYYTEEASGLFRARISRPVSNGTVTVTPLVSVVAQTGRTGQGLYDASKG